MICQECHVGRLQPARAPYLAWLDGRMLVIPSVPAWLCDACGDLIHDFDFVHGLRLLLENGQADDGDEVRRPAIAADRAGWPRLRRVFPQ